MINESEFDETKEMKYEAKEEVFVEIGESSLTYEAAVQESEADYAKVLQACSSEKDKKELKPVLLILTCEQIKSLAPNTFQFSQALEQELKKINSSKTSNDYMNEAFAKRKQKKIVELLANVATDDSRAEKFKKQLIEEIGKSEDVLSLNKIFESTAISYDTQLAIWKALANPLFVQLMLGWSLKSQVTEEIRAILKFCLQLKDEDELLKSLCSAVVEHRNTQPVMKNEFIQLSIQKKEELTKTIQKLKSFKMYCDIQGRDKVQVEKRVKLWLLELLSIDMEVRDNTTKLSIINTLITNPHAIVRVFDTHAKDQQGKLKAALKDSIQVQEHKQCQRNQLTLAERKVKAIDDILVDRLVTDRDRPEVRRLLEQGNMDELFKNPTVWRQHIEYFDLIHNKKETAAYKLAIEQNNQDIDEIENKLKESIDSILEEEGVSSTIITKVSTAVLSDKGDLKSIQGDNGFSRDQQASLPQKIESLDEYKLLKKLKWQPVDLEKKTQFEILNALIHANTAKRDFADTVELTKKIINGKTLDEVSSSGSLTPTDKITIIDILSNAEKCPNLTQYLRYYGCHKETNEYQLKEALVPVQRQLKIDFTVFRALQESFLREQSFEAARSSDQLTELQRESLLKFLLTNEACSKFLQACKIYKAVEQIDTLRSEVERQLVKATRSGRKGAAKYVGVIYGAVIDFCKIDESISDKTYDDTEVGDVIGDEALMSAYQDIEASEPYQEFMGSYGFLATTRLKMSEDSLKRYFMSLIDLNRQNREHGEELFKDWSTVLKFERGSLAGYKESEIGTGVVRRIAAEIQKSEQYESFMKNADALNLRKQLIGSSLFGSAVEDLKYQQELWKLDRESLTEVLDGLKHFNVDTLQNTTLLTPDQKKEVAGKLIRSDGFEKYWNAKDELEQSNFDTLEHFKASLEEITKEVMKERPVSPVKERPAEDKQEVSPPRITKKPEPAVTTKPSLTTAKPADQKKAGKAPPPPPPKDEDFLKSKPNYSGQLFTEMGITVEQFKNNTTPQFRKTYANKFTAEIVKLVDKMWTEASTPGNDTALGLFISNENPNLHAIRETITAGSTDFKCEIKAKIKERFIDQLTSMPDFKRIQELVAIKKKLAE